MSNIFRFDGSRLRAAPDPLSSGASPDIADSFLLRHGKIRGWEQHRSRFEENIAEHAPELLGQLENFWNASARKLEEEAEAFPRFEVVEGALWLRIRPAPLVTSEINAVSIPLDVSRADLKGPNISLYAELNARNQAETLRLSPSGHVLEGVTSAVVWWDEQTLCLPPQSDRVNSTTEQAIVKIARDRGFQVRERWITREDLVRHEAWALNAVHGIRLLTSLDGIALPSATEPRLGQFRADFEGTWLPLMPGTP